MSSRRNVIVGGTTSLGALIIGSLLEGCGTMTSNQLELDAEAAANAVDTMAVTLEGVIPASNTALLQKVETAAKIAGQDATSLSGLAKPANTAALIDGIVNAIVTYDEIIPMFFPASAPIILVLNAALIVGKGMYAEAGLPTPAAARMKTPAVAMPVSTARAVLSKVHARGNDHR